MRWDSDLATVVLGLNDNVPNELGFKNFWLVKNQTGSTITKGSLVYANGTVGASGRITVAKFIANGSIDAKYLLGITAHDLSNGEDGYVISFGKIRQVNTDTFAAGAILYPSPTVAGVWTDVEPIAPNIDMPIGFCINSHVNNGTIAIRLASGYKLSELHDVAISSPVDKASLYYSGGLWRDTTAALLVSDTASMLDKYLRLSGGTLTGALNGTSLNFSSGAVFNENANNSDFRVESVGRPNMFFVDAFNNRVGIGTNSPQAMLEVDGTLEIRDSATFYRGAKFLKSNPNTRFLIEGTNKTMFYGNLNEDKIGIGTTLPTKTLDVNGTLNATDSVTFGNTLSVTGNITENGLNVLTSADTTSMLTPYFRDADTTLLNLTSRFATKLNINDTASMLTNYLRSGVAASTYLPLTGGTVTGNTNFVPTSGNVIFGETSPVWDEVLGVRPRSTTSLGLGIYSSSTSYSGSLFRAQSENTTGSSYMLYEGRSAGGLPAFWVKGDGSSYFEKNITIGSEVNNDALDVHHDGDHGIRMSYLTAPSAYNFSIKPKVTAANVRYVFSQTNNNTFYDSILVFNQGNIGINKLNPSYKLDVNGTFNSTGNITEGGLNVLTSGDTTSMLLPYWRSGRFSGVLPVANGGTGSNIGNITGSDSLHFQAGGSNKNVRITPATTGDIILNGDVSIGNRPAQERLSIGLNTNVEVGFGLESGGKGYLGTYSPPTYTYDGIVLSINRRPTNGVFANTNFSHAEIAVVAANSDSYIGFFTGQTNNVIGTERMRIIKNGDIGIGISSPTQKLHVVGNGRFTAVGAGTFANNLNITSDGTLTTATSDEKYKYNILPISYGLNTILQLKPVNFQWIEGEENDLGFIAQDVADIIPEAVNANWNSDLLMRYESIIPILTKAIQEQNALIKALEQRILILENK